MVIQVKGQSRYSPVGQGVPEARQCPEDRGKQSQSEVFQDYSSHKPSHLPFLQRLQGGQDHPWVLEDPPVQALPVAETGLLREHSSATKYI